MKTLLKHCPRLKHCPSKKGESAALTSIQVKSGTATITDARFWLSFPLDKPDGFYSITEARADIWKPAKGLGDLEFPQIEIPNKQPIEVPVSISDLTWISSAMSNEKIRYYLNGVYFDNAGMTATDGHILKHVAQPFAGEEKPSAILPDFAVKIILDAAKEEKVTGISIQFIGPRAIVAIGRYLLRTKLVDGTFPDYTRVIPESTTGLAIAFDSEEIKPLLKKARALDPECQTVIVGQNSCHIHKAPEEAVKLSGSWEMPLAFNCGLLVSADIAGTVNYAMEGMIKITNRNRVCVTMSQRLPN